MIVHRLVDAAWYLAAYEDVATFRLGPVVHYLRHGRHEGRKPNRYFDAAFYAAQAANSGVAIKGDALAHYVGHGEPAGLMPSEHFDPAWYRATYRIADGYNCLDDYLSRRANGAVSPNRHFDARHYTAEYPDVAAIGVDPYEHWVVQGGVDGRFPMAERSLILQSGLFDENYYLTGAGDVFDAAVDALDHFIASGWREGRAPNPYFDVGWYVRQHPMRMYANPLTDYILCGEAADSSPGPLFDTRWYRATYAIAPGSSPLRHWLEHRRSRAFSPLASFDVARYVADAGGRIRPHHDPFLHALATEAMQRRPTRTIG